MIQINQEYLDFYNIEVINVLKKDTYEPFIQINYKNGYTITENINWASMKNKEIGQNNIINGLVQKNLRRKKISKILTKIKNR